VVLLTGTQTAGQRVNQQFIGGGAVGRKHLRAAHDKPVTHLVDHAEVNEGLRLL